MRFELDGRLYTTDPHGSILLISLSVCSRRIELNCFCHQLLQNHHVVLSSVLFTNFKECVLA